MRQLKRFITPTALLAALTFAASSSFAQEKYHGRRDGQPQPAAGAPARQEGRAQPRSEAPRAQPRQDAQPQRPAEQSRAQQPQQQRQAEQPRAQQPQQQRQAEQPRAQQPQQQRQAEQPRAQQQQRQAMQPPRAQSRDEGRQNQGRADTRRFDNRGNGDTRRYESGRAVPRGNVYAPRYEPRYTPRGYGYYGSRTYNRPYVFRPRFSIGFGIFAGFPVPYTYSYSYPIEVYGYRAPRERVMITANSPYYGGVVLEMSPYDADVFVDGTYAGRVEDFDGSQQPLTLTVGMHEIEVQAQGYEPMRVTVEVQPGQIIPYRGDLRPY